MFRTRQAVAEPRSNYQCAFESWDPTTPSTPSMIFYIADAKSRPSSSRQYAILATRGISHPCLGSAASYPRSSQYLHRISLAQCMQWVTEHLLAIFSLRMSSSLTTLSRILLLSVSTTKTFHCDALIWFPRAGDLGLHHHGLCSLWRRQ